MNEMNNMPDAPQSEFLFYQTEDGTSRIEVKFEGDRDISRNIDYYNLDMILTVGYRVRSARGVEFRRWATERLHEYIVKGFALNDDQLKQVGGGKYIFSRLSASARWFS